MVVKAGDTVIKYKKLIGFVTTILPTPLIEYSNGFVEYLDYNNLINYKLIKYE